MPFTDKPRPSRQRLKDSDLIQLPEPKPELLEVPECSEPFCHYQACGHIPKADNTSRFVCVFHRQQAERGRFFIYDLDEDACVDCDGDPNCRTCHGTEVVKVEKYLPLSEETLARQAHAQAAS